MAHYICILSTEYRSTATTGEAEIIIGYSGLRQRRTHRRCGDGSLRINEFPYKISLMTSGWILSETLRVSSAGNDIAGRLREH